MKKIQNMTYRTQIFLACLILVILPPIMMGIITANRTANNLNDNYSQTLKTITNQTNLTLDTLLTDATKIADLPLLNDAVRKALITNYKDDYLSYAKDSTMMKTQLLQANRMNPNVISCLFLNRYNYTYNYNILNSKYEDEILENMKEWSDIARNSNHFTYFGPIQDSKYTGSIYKNILPMVKILNDPYTNKEIGALYIGINFNSIEDVLASANSNNSTMLFYNEHGDLIYSTNKDLYNKNSGNTLTGSLKKISTSISQDTGMLSQNLKINKNNYLVNGCFNKTTGWHIIHFMDDTIIRQAYAGNLLSYLGILCITVLFGLILAFLLSRSLTKSIRILCKEIDTRDSTNYNSIPVDGTISNQELKKVVTSFNHLNQRLTESIKQNYTIRLNEQQMRIQMLQSQINHHFLYNTLNVIKSLADIHNVPEIKTISMCMSDLLRYNLKKVPIVRLEEEIAQIHRYITIQEIRFPDKFIFDCNIPKELYELEIPAFILQPLVENSIDHGFSEKECGCYISVSANLDSSNLDSSFLHFLVADNGTGITKEKLQLIRKSLESEKLEFVEQDNHNSIGVRNVHQRIQSYYGKDYGLSIESYQNQGTIVDICIPYMQPPQLPDIDDIITRSSLDKIN